MSLPVLLLAGRIGYARILAEPAASDAAAGRRPTGWRTRKAPVALKPAPDSPRLDTTTTDVILHM